jgi:hypothetical protein
LTTNLTVDGSGLVGRYLLRFKTWCLDFFLFS